LAGEAQQLETTLPAEPASAPLARATVAEHSRTSGVEGHPTGKTIWVELLGT